MPEASAAARRGRSQRRPTCAPWREPQPAAAPVRQPVLSVRDLVIAFPTRRGLLTAVDGVSFDIAAGEVLGVVGESGAGKSLTGAAVIGLLEPPGRIVHGSIHLQGQRIDNLEPD